MDEVDESNFNLSDEINSEEKRDMIVASIIAPSKPSVPALRKVPFRMPQPATIEAVVQEV